MFCMLCDAFLEMSREFDLIDESRLLKRIAHFNVQIHMNNCSGYGADILSRPSDYLWSHMTKPCHASKQWQPAARTLCSHRVGHHLRQRPYQWLGHQVFCALSFHIISAPVPAGTSNSPTKLCAFSNARLPQPIDQISCTSSRIAVARIFSLARSRGYMSNPCLGQP